MKKIKFSFSKVNFSLLEKKILLKKVDFFYFRSYERSELSVHQNFRSIHDPIYAANCRTLKESRKVFCRVLGFHRLITYQHSTHTHHDARRLPHNFLFLSFPGTIFQGPIFRGPFFSGIIRPRTIFLGDHSSTDYFSEIQFKHDTKSLSPSHHNPKRETLPFPLPRHFNSKEKRTTYTYI